MPKNLGSWTRLQDRKPGRSRAEGPSRTKHHSTGGIDILKRPELLLFFILGFLTWQFLVLQREAALSTQRLDNLCTHFKTGCTQKYR